MGIFKSLLYGEAGSDYEQNFAEYTESFGRQPALISCDLNFIKYLPSPVYNCCVKIRMDVMINPQLHTLISEAEAAYIASMRSILSEHIGGRFVGQGIIAATRSAFLIFYIPERQSRACRKMLSETFVGSFRNVETGIVYDPEGKQYKKYLYPNELQKRKINNLKMQRSLLSYGDDGLEPRPVKFNLIFQNKKDATDCCRESQSRGFVLKALNEEPPPEGLVLPRQRLVLEKRIPFDTELLMRIDNYLLKLAEKYRGEYGVIETDILKINER